jgi:rhodanese-related sulfurtransferase
MNGSFLKDIRLAILIAIAASVIGLIVNTVRTPVLDGLVKSGKIHITTHKKYMGLRLVDDWSHKGKLKQVKSVEEIEDVEDQNGEEPIVITTPVEPVLREIDFLDAERIYESGEAVFLDARISSEYEKGHIAGAKSWPQNRFLEYLDIYEEQIPYDTHLVLYCEGGKCDQSQRLLEDLSFSGYLVIDLYYGGYEEWLNLGMPYETGVGQ